ncbi:hypothetical protein GCM10027079_11730 [Sediminivirga luteola]|uniref:Uncharacterized protein n=1 Tax=Sediminivirga luteola TaxID=1774748 RepID=A0A8J2TYY6_9MICO|nr:hypothetical protein GCM10011333_21820 [Sediminivirga luteola]
MPAAQQRDDDAGDGGVLADHRLADLGADGQQRLPQRVGHVFGLRGAQCRPALRPRLAWLGVLTRLAGLAGRR